MAGIVRFLTTDLAASRISHHDLAYDSSVAVVLKVGYRCSAAF
ncbi:hypothetical protein [Propionivibrio sp.]